MRLGVVALLGLVVPRVPLDQREGLLLASAGGGERGGVDLGLEGDAPEVLLLIVLAYWKLVVRYVVPLQRTGVVGDSLLELLVLLLEGLLQVGHDLGALALQAQLADGLLHRDAQVCLLYYVLQLRGLVYKESRCEGRLIDWAEVKGLSICMRCGEYCARWVVKECWFGWACLISCWLL